MNLPFLLEKAFRLVDTPPINLNKKEKLISNKNVINIKPCRSHKFSTLEAYEYKMETFH